jgi:hypothetical protein
MEMRLPLLLACLLAITAQAQEKKHELWTWKDEQGVTHYSDRPVAGARKLEVTTMTPAESESTPAPSPVTTEPSRPSQPAAVEYSSLEIWQPEQGESFFGPDSSVEVRIRVEPEIAPGHRLLLYMDGKLVEGPVNATEYTLAGLERGAYTLTAAISDEQGMVVYRSNQRSFQVRQPTIIEPRAVGPNLKPKPPPVPTPRPGTPK